MELNNMKKLLVTPQGEQLLDYTAEEISQHQVDVQNEVVRKEAEEQEKQSKANAKASALAKLSALGLTEEEVNSIL
jgi:predicted dinucleotide-utilizing enzyme